MTQITKRLTLPTAAFGPTRTPPENRLKSALKFSVLRGAISASVAVLLFAAATPARADGCGSAPGNLVVNCGFENGVNPSGSNIPAGWTVSQWNGEEAITTTPVNSGSNSLRISNDINQGGPLFSGAAILSQSFTDTVGEIYDFNFFLYNGAQGSPSELFQAFYDSTSGTPLLSTDGSTVGKSFTEFSYSVVGTGSDSITFTAYNNPSWFWLDDVEVLDTGTNTGTSSSVTPEPSCLAMFGTGLLATFGMARRKCSNR